MHVRLAVVGLLVHLVADHVAGGLGARAQAGVAVFRHALVRFLGRGRGPALHRLGDVVRCVSWGKVRVSGVERGGKEGRGEGREERGRRGGEGEGLT